MSALSKEDYRKYLLIILTLILVVISYLIIKPFIIPIISAIILGYLFYPIYKWANKKIIKNKTLLAIIIVIIVIFLITIPTILIVNKLSKETYVAYLLGKQSLAKLGGTENPVCEGNIICTSANSVKHFLSSPSMQYQLRKTLDKVSTFFNEQISKFILNIPKILLGFFLTFFIMYFILKEGDTFALKTKNLLPLSIKHKDKIVKRFNAIISSTVYGGFLVALIQGSIATVGYWIFGVSTPLIWGLITVITAMIPFLGATAVYLPISLIMILNGILNTTTNEITKGILLLLYGLLIVSTIDNFLKPKIIGRKAQLHPVVVLLGIFGGIAVFGFIGVIIGPLILGLLVESIKIYEEETKKQKK